MNQREVIVVGGGPIGIELGVALQQAGVDHLHLEAGQIGQTMLRWPPMTRWFSSPERIEIAGVPIQTLDQSKCTREEYLAYLRSVVMQFDLDVRTYEPVVEVGRRSDGFAVVTRARGGERRTYRGRYVVLATGGNAEPNLLGIPGEDLPHVSHFMAEPHVYFRRHVVIVGGRNSAVEAAIRLYRAGARVEISYRGASFPDKVKYWLRPEIQHLIKTGRIAAHMETVATAISPTHVTLEPVGDDGEPLLVPADFVLLMVGYRADMDLFGGAGVTLEGDDEVPRFDPETMETDVPGLYVAGTAAAGTQRSGVTLFLENCHVHVERIVAAITGAAPPPEPAPQELPEA